MEILLVRSVEKALDAAHGRLRSTAWNTVLSENDCLKVLQVSAALESLLDHTCVNK